MGERLVLAMVLVRTAVVPTGTLPKSTTAGVATNPLLDCATGVLASRAPQPSMVIKRKRTDYQITASAEFLHGRPLKPYGHTAGDLPARCTIPSANPGTD